MDDVEFNDLGLLSTVRSFPGWLGAMLPPLSRVNMEIKSSPKIIPIKAYKYSTSIKKKTT